MTDARTVAAAGRRRHVAFVDVAVAVVVEAVAIRVGRMTCTRNAGASVACITNGARVGVIAWGSGDRRCSRPASRRLSAFALSIRSSGDDRAQFLSAQDPIVKRDLVGSAEEEPRSSIGCVKSADNRG